MKPDAVDRLFAEVIVEVFMPSTDEIADMLLSEAADLELDEAGALEVAFQIRAKALEHALDELAKRV